MAEDKTATLNIETRNDQITTEEAAEKTDRVRSDETFIYLAYCGENDSFQAYEFDGTNFVDTEHRDDGKKFRLEKQIKQISLSLELRKTCGNTQKSRWACRGCQYVGECK